MFFFSAKRPDAAPQFIQVYDNTVSAGCDVCEGCTMVVCSRVVSRGVVCTRAVHLHVVGIMYFLADHYMIMHTGYTLQKVKLLRRITIHCTSCSVLLKCSVCHTDCGREVNAKSRLPRDWSPGTGSEVVP